jgi:hypothetical protein
MWPTRDGWALRPPRPFTLGEIVLNARWRRSYVTPAGRRRTVFVSEVDGRRYRLVCRPLADESQRIISVRRTPPPRRRRRSGAEYADEPRGAHRKRRGRSRRGIHEAANARRIREQAAAARRAERQRLREAAAARAAALRTPEGVRLQNELNAAKNQLRHARLAGDTDRADALQAQVHELSAALARFLRGESEMETVR